MPFNPSPPVAAARDFANKFGAEMVIILHIGPTGQIGYASYGKTKSWCKVAKGFAEAALQAAESHMDTLCGTVTANERKE